MKKRERLHKKRVQLPQDWFGTSTWPPFHCFGTPIWPAVTSCENTLKETSLLTNTVFVGIQICYEWKKESVTRTNAPVVDTLISMGDVSGSIAIQYNSSIILKGHFQTDEAKCKSFMWKYKMYLTSLWNWGLGQIENGLTLMRHYLGIESNGKRWLHLPALLWL